MGGSVIAEAARLMPTRVIGLIGIDTLENIEYPMTREELNQMTDPLEKDFGQGSRQFVGEMISSQTDPQLHEWILSDMSAASPAVALSAMNEMMSQYITGESAKIFDEIRIPVVTVNGDLWPINYEANRCHMFSFDAIVLKKSDHFLMMDCAEELNRALEKAINIRGIEGTEDLKKGFLLIARNQSAKRILARDYSIHGTHSPAVMLRREIHHTRGCHFLNCRLPIQKIEVFSLCL